MVVAVRRADLLERLATVPRPPESDVDDVHLVLLLRGGVDAGVVPGALAEVAVLARLVPRLAAVRRAKDAAFGVRAEQVPEGGGVNDVRVFGVDADAGQVARVAEANVLPRLAGVGGLPHTRAVRHVAADGLLPAADVDHVRVRL